MTMTREDHLYSMRMQDLKAVADKLGVKINTKAAKSIAVEKILEAEAGLEKNKPEEINLKNIKNQKDFMNAVSDVLDGKKVVKKPTKAPDSPIKAVNNNEAINNKPAPKKSNLRLSELTYKGKTQSIKAWAEELKMPWPTLYDRVNRNGWPVDLAIETPLGQRRPKKA